MEINTMLLITQLLNFLILIVIFALPALVIYHLLKRREPRTEQVMVRRVEQGGYVRLRADEIQSIDLIDEQEAVIRLRDDQKVRIDAEAAEQLVQRLSR